MKVILVQDGKDIERSIRNAIRRDDGEALDMIWDRHGDELLAFLTARLCSRTDAEDVLQSVFVRVARVGMAVRAGCGHAIATAHGGRGWTAADRIAAFAAQRTLLRELTQDGG